MSRIAALLCALASVAAVAQTVGTPIALPPTSGARHLALNPVTNKLYLGTTSGPMIVIDVATRAQVPVSSGISAAMRLAVNPETNTVYVGNAGSGTLSIFDGASDSLVAQTGVVGAGEWAIDVIGDRAYSARLDTPLVNVLAGRAFVVSAHPRSKDARVIAANPITRRVYTAFENGGARDLVAMDMTSPTAYPPLLCPDGAGGFQPQPPQPPEGQPDTWNTPCTAIPARSIAVNPVTNKVYAAYGGFGDNSQDGVRVIDGGNHTSVFVPIGPQGVIAAATNPVTNKVFAAGYQVFAIIDGATNAATVFPMHASTGSPLGMAVNLLTNMVYVVDSNNRLWTLDGATGSATIIALPVAGIQALAFDPSRDMIYALEYARVTPIAGVPRPHAATGITTTITPLPGNVTPTASGTFTLNAASSLAPAPLGNVRKVYYRVTAPGDTPAAAWHEAAGSGPYTAQYSGLSRGVTYTLEAFATIGLESGATYGGIVSAPLIGNIAAYSFQTSDPTSGPPPDLAISQGADMDPPAKGKDVVFTIIATNNGPAAASGVTITDTLPPALDFVWATPGCIHASGTVTCNAGNLAAGASTTVRVVGRPNTAGATANAVSVGGAETDETPANNAHSLPLAVAASPAGVAQPRYRLYSPVTHSHLFTTDANEYATLGNQGWVQEGVSGKLLDNPGVFNGVAAVPYYRLYSPGFHWHHWTSDANEYYTLSTWFPGWVGERWDGFILPSAATGATPLYRLMYPPVAALHHWTIDPVEYNALVTSYGWIGEGGSGFVIQ